MEEVAIVRRRPQLRVFTHDDGEPDPPPKAAALDEATRELVESLGLSPDLPERPSAALTLPEFFVVWYWPVIARGRDSAAGTILKLVDSLRWWRRLTSDPVLGFFDDLAVANDPPLSLIDEVTQTEFQEALRRATWRRGKLGEWDRLKPATIAGHLRRVQQVLDYAGPTLDPKRPSKELISRVWRFDIQKPKPRPRPDFTLQQARAIVEACTLLPPSPGYPPPDFWRTFFGIMFVSGLRIGSMLLLRWEWFVEDRGVWWFRVPEEGVPKTDKPDDFAMPTWLSDHLALRRRPSGPVCSWRMHSDTLDKIHRRVQRALGIEPLGFNAWRRTLDTQMIERGKRQLEELGRLALNHGDVATTKGHYCDIDNLIRPLLPPLWDGPIGARQGRLFD